MSKEFKVGLLAVVAAVMLYFGFNFLRGIDFFSPTNHYYAKYDHIDGLTVSNPVIIKGMAVGRVSKMTINQDDGNTILVELDVDESVKIRKSSNAKLTSTGFLGSKAIQIELGDKGDFVESGDTLNSFIDGGLAEIMQKAEPLTDNLGVTISSINKILLGMEGSGKVLKSSLDKLDQTLNSVNHLMASSKDGIPVVVSTYKSLGDSLIDLSSEFNSVAKNANTLAENAAELDIKRLESSIFGLTSSIDSLLNTMTSGNGTMGRLMQDDSLYSNLNEASVSMNVLLRHFNEYPKHFLSPFGKKSKKIKKALEEGDDEELK